MNELQTQSVGMTTLAGFELGQRVAKMLATSNLVPQAYKGNVADCMIALNMANRMGADPLQVLQNLIVVHGKPTWSSQFLIATFNGCGKFSSIKYEFFGSKGSDDYGCRAVATELSTGERLEGPDVTIGLAKAEGWYGRNGSKWKSIPDLMLRYRAAAWFVRTVAPELSMGLHTQEEILDVEKEINPLPKKKGRSVEDLISRVTTIDAEEIVDHETGEITEADDGYGEIRIAIRDCETISDIANLLKSLSPDEKASLLPEIRSRQDEINAAKEAA